MRRTICDVKYVANATQIAYGKSNNEDSFDVRQISIINATNVISSKTISTRAGVSSLRLKNKRLQRTLSAALAIKRSTMSLLRIFEAFLLLKIMSAEIVVRIKIIFHAIGNAIFGGVMAGWINCVSYHDMPELVRKLPRAAVAIVTNGMMK